MKIISERVQPHLTAALLGRFRHTRVAQYLGLGINHLRELATPPTNKIWIGSEADISDFKTRTEQLRLEFLKAKTPQDKSKAIYEALCNEAALRDHAYLATSQFQELARSLVADTLTGDYLNSRRLMDEAMRNGSNIRMGVFYVPYATTELNKEPSFEAMMFTRCPENIRFERDHRSRTTQKSQAMLIQDSWNTKGFSPPEQFVAHFPEHWPTSKPDDAEALAVYVINRFVLRTNSFTFPVLDTCISPKSFLALRQFRSHKDQAALVQAAVKWLSGHEYNHGQGLLPLTVREGNEELKAPSEGVLANAAFGFQLKGSRETAAFEEMRVDLRNLVRLYSFAAENNYKRTNERDAESVKLAREMILLERLVRYPLQTHPNENFDAITSSMLLNFLIEKEAICLDDKGCLALQGDDRIRIALTQFQNLFNAIEKDIANNLDLSNEADMKEAKAKIKQFVREWACKHENNPNLKAKIEPGKGFRYARDYTLHPFHVMAKQKLRERNVETYSASNSFVEAEPYRPNSQVSLIKLFGDDLAVYGDRFAKTPEESKDAVFLKYMNNLASTMDDSAPMDLNPGDGFLAKLAAGDLDGVDHFPDKELIALVMDESYQGPEHQWELINHIRRNYGKNFNMQAHDERFISRIKRIIRAKIAHYNTLGPELPDGILSARGPMSLEKLIEEGNEERRMKMTNKTKQIGIRTIAALMLSMGMGGLWWSASALTPSPEVEVPNKGGHQRKDDQKAPNIEIKDIHKPVDLAPAPANDPITSQSLTIRPRDLTVIEITLGDEFKLKADGRKPDVPEYSDTKPALELNSETKKVIEKLLPIVIERTLKQEDFINLVKKGISEGYLKSPMSMKYSIMPSNYALGDNEVEIMGLSIDKTSIRISSSAILKIVNKEISIQDWSEKIIFKIR